MRTRACCTTVVLAILAVACGDQPTEVVPDRNDAGVPEGQMAQGPGMIAMATSSSDDGLSITTDKDDYAPGDTVWFTGAGWPANDTLDILLEDEPATHEPHTWSVPVGEDGTFRDSTYVVDVDDIGVTFTLTATSRATERWLTVVFTDGNFKYTTDPTNLVASIPFQRFSGTCGSGILQSSGTFSNNTNANLVTGSHYDFSVPTVLGFTYNGYSTSGNITASPASSPSNTALCIVTSANNGSGSIELQYLDNTTTTLGHSPASTNVGQQVTFTATVKDHNGDPIGNKGSVTFYEFTGVQSCNALGAATPLAGPVNLTNNPSGQASFQTIGLSAGTHVITGCYSGTTAFTKSFGTVSHPVTVPDNQPPTINCSVLDPTMWYDNNQIVSCTASDPSGLKVLADASFSLSTNVPVNTETPTAGTGSRQVCDNLNNCATAGPFSFKVDRKSPVVSCGSADGNWHAADVSIACTATEGGSGLATAGDANFNLLTNVATNTENANASTNSRAVLDAVGNSATAGPVSGNKVDKKAPAFSCEAPDGAWHDADVTLSCAASDGGSGLDDAGDASFDLSTSVTNGTETANASTDSKTVKDKVANSATAGPITGNKIDKKAPAVACGAADGNWHGSDVSIDCTASDGGSGLEDPNDSDFNLTTSVPSGTETANASTNSKTIKDAVGHSTPAGPIAGNKVDKKDPAVSCGAADGDWHGSDVLIGCTASDGGSGLEDADDANFDLKTSVPDGTETANASTNSRSVLDAVGNSTGAGPISGNKVDKKDPAVSCDAADGEWHALDVSIDCAASDGGSGLANPTDGTFSLSTNVPAGSETANGSTGSKNVADMVGNSATAGPIGGNQVDKKGPAVALTCPVSPVLLNAPVSANWTATDGGSGVASGFASGSFGVPTNQVGQTTATAAPGVSHDKVGNPSSASAPCGYSVQFAFSGFRAPVDNNGTLNGANSGQAIPLKWELRDYAGNPVTTLVSVTVTVATLACSAGVTTDLIEEYAAGASGLQNHGGGSYQFNWKTPTSYSRSCKTMKLDLGEGTLRTALFEFRK
jgi:Big-like domain-containing protein